MHVALMPWAIGHDVCPSVCNAGELWPYSARWCEIFDTAQKGNHSSFLAPTVVLGRRSLPSEICAQSDPPLQWRRQNFAPGGTGAWRTGSEVRGDKVIQKWKPSAVRSAKFARIRKLQGGTCPSAPCLTTPLCTFEKRRLRQISADNASTARNSKKKVQLWRIGRRPRAFQRAIDGVRTLLLRLPTQKAMFSFFTKMQL